VISSDSDFAEGNARILLFEAYYFIGKQYHAAGLNRDALKYLQEAEILAWNDSGNLLKLFRLQIMIGDTYGELENYRDAVSYYQYAYDYIQVFSRINNVPSAMNKYSDAISYEENQDYDRAYMAYKGLFEYIDDIYSVREVEINTGVCLALFASENQSIVDVILEANNLPMSMVITYGRTLKVPVIDN
jgi:tetratricopeptide (TPR) repeat protein